MSNDHESTTRAKPIDGRFAPPFFADPTSQDAITLLRSAIETRHDTQGIDAFIAFDRDKK